MSCSFDIKPGDRHCEFCTVIGCGERDGAQYDTAATTSALPHGHYENVCQSRGISRAEEAALKAYPNVEQPVWDKSYPKTLFVRHTERNAYTKGYEQAMKDCALTAEDVKEIFNKVLDFQNKYCSTEGCYQEVADWFNERRKLKEI